MFANKTLLVTGGTGSFGQTVVRKLIETSQVKEILIFSRDEKKQHDMRLSLNNPKVKFFIGDVRDKSAVLEAMRGVDFVFHAAALKQVPTCEFFPMEAVKTNILGTENVLSAAEYHGIERAVILSTDKAVYPINALGMSKALMEKITVAKSRESKTSVVFCVVRYGNVMYSRGSVIPLFVHSIKSGKPIPVTNPHMTRFLLSLENAVDLVLFALKNGRNGDILVRKAPACTIGDLAKACKELFKADNEIVIQGIREGEKVHESLVSWEELISSEEMGDYYRIPCDRNRNYDEYFIGSSKNIETANTGYTSCNAHRLSVSEIKELLLQLREIREKLTFSEKTTP